MFVDNIRIFARAGKGGNGLVSFRRAKFVPKGRARTAVMEAMAEASFWKWIRTRMTCVLFFYDPKLIATDGVGGQSAKKHGKNGKSVIGKVPPGTIIYRSNASSMAEATWLEREGEGIELEKNSGSDGNRHPVHAVPGRPRRQGKLAFPFRDQPGAYGSRDGNGGGGRSLLYGIAPHCGRRAGRLPQRGQKAHCWETFRKPSPK